MSHGQMAAVKLAARRSSTTGGRVDDCHGVRAAIPSLADLGFLQSTGKIDRGQDSPLHRLVPFYLFIFLRWREAGKAEKPAMKKKNIYIYPQTQRGRSRKEETKRLF